MLKVYHSGNEFHDAGYKVLLKRANIGYAHLLTEEIFRFCHIDIQKSNILKHNNKASTTLVKCISIIDKFSN